ncbi:protein CDV3 homolog [Hippocampus comes]|uniref:Carnitine deficiency-associated gene expressed in ventricle 3 n=1 Tax=Hippocampus comes TaxID=109280 RepID=A0A3Q2Y6E4_HIPCM|nr:PREDICTED: protein CDV3 homolog [Hippocampus comes]
MADVSSEKSLDDFFAKRDKKKKKDKGKAKESAASSTGLKKSKKENEKSFKGDGQDGNMDKEDEDWKEQKEVDYSGLRLQAMQISDDKEEDDYEDDDREHDEDGDVLVTAGGEKMSGPWNKSTHAPAQAPPVEDVETPEKPAGVYRPPGARYSSSKRGQNQGPPEIFSDTQFPSLMATGKHVETRKDREIDKTFEVVKHKGRGRDDGNATAAMQHLQLDNQYAVLGDK